MPKGDSYEVLVDQLTIPKTTRRGTNPVTGTEFKQNGKGKTWLKGEKVGRDDVADHILEALDDSDHPNHESISKKLKPVSGGPAEDSVARLGVPFAGYEDMSEDDVVAAMKNLPSTTIQNIKKYEAEYGDNREGIVEYSIGHGESAVARREGSDLVVSPGEKASTAKKATAKASEKSESAEARRTARKGRRPRSGGKAKAKAKK